MIDGYELKGGLMSFRTMYWKSDLEVVVEWEN